MILLLWFVVNGPAGPFCVRRIGNSPDGQSRPVWQQALEDADTMIANEALSLAETAENVVIVGRKIC